MRRTTTRWLLGLVAAVLVLASCSSNAATVGSVQSSSVDGGPIPVVAAENFWGDLIHQIGGSHVAVTSIIDDPSKDPHEYESSASDAAALSRARFVLVNGLGYDDFLDKLLSVSSDAPRDVLNVGDLLKIKGQNPNPHIWYDTARLPEVARAVATELGKLQPGAASEFSANAATFEASLEPIVQTITTIKSKYAGTPVAATERVAGYLIDAAGLTLGNPPSFTEAVEQGNDPSPQAVAAFAEVITSRKVKLLIYNAQVTDAETDDVKGSRSEPGVPVVGVTETLPPSEASFQDWQLRQSKELLAALGG